MFSLRGGKRERGKLYAKQKRNCNKREENEMRQRDPSNNRTTMSTQCGFSSPAEKGLKQRKSTCSRLPQSKTVLCIRPKQHHSCPFPNSTELCRTYPVTLKAGLRLWSTTQSAPNDTPQLSIEYCPLNLLLLSSALFEISFASVVFMFPWGWFPPWKMALSDTAVFLD